MGSSRKKNGAIRVSVVEMDLSGLTFSTAK
jgi:hypothetical protein